MTYIGSTVRNMGGLPSERCEKMSRSGSHQMHWVELVSPGARRTVAAYRVWVSVIATAALHRSL